MLRIIVRESASMKQSVWNICVHNRGSYIVFLRRGWWAERWYVRRAKPTRAWFKCCAFGAFSFINMCMYLATLLCLGGAKGLTGEWNDKWPHQFGLCWLFLFHIAKRVHQTIMAKVILSDRAVFMCALLGHTVKCARREYEEWMLIVQRKSRNIGGYREKMCVINKMYIIARQMYYGRYMLCVLLLHLEPSKTTKPQIKQKHRHTQLSTSVINGAPFRMKHHFVYRLPIILLWVCWMRAARIFLTSCAAVVVVRVSSSMLLCMLGSDDNYCFMEWIPGGLGGDFFLPVSCAG